MRYFLVCFLMLVFSLQVLPAKKIGKLLCKAQSTEEAQNYDDSADDDAPGTAGLFNNDIIFEHQSFDQVTCAYHLEKRIVVTIHKAETMPLPLVAKIPSPPPEC